MAVLKTFSNNFSTYNIQDACDVVNGDEDMTTIVFNLICAADQSPYYSFPNNNNNYGQQLNQVSSRHYSPNTLLPLLLKRKRKFHFAFQVKVEVSGSWKVTSSITSLILAFLVARLSL